MIVWGGRDASAFGDGATYNPGADSWNTLSSTGAPGARYHHTAIWTGTEMVVWGGTDGAANFNSGARYDPLSDMWTPTSTTGAPSARAEHGAVWTGTEMIIWGGTDGTSTLNDGAKYSPATDSWTPISIQNSPSSRCAHGTVWAEVGLVIWGGASTHQNRDLNSLDNGAIYYTSTDSWETLPDSNTQATAPPKAHSFRALLQKEGMPAGEKRVILWGGKNDSGFLNQDRILNIRD
jgi:N-acetylneuraminic acid mutarotase